MEAKTMMRKTFFISVIAAIALLAACEKEAPVPMQMEMGVQIDISGNRAAIVKADTARLVIMRDSVADEKTDTIYNLHTSLTLILDSTFLADKMEDSLLLSIGDITLAPTDIVLADTLIAFIKRQPGAAVSINFAGQAVRSQFLLLGTASEATLSGFSFHELDPESLADPKITQLLDRWQNLVYQYRREVNELEEVGGRGIPGMFIYEEEAKCYKQLLALTEQMTPGQKARFDKLDNICKKELSFYMPRLNG